ncbi:MAG: glycogen/starch synthase [Lentimicrobiaceae bacterium]|nr:glycogen/starch synthase [Lentimicrobiaceae bacterium]
MEKLRVLFVTQEITPFMKESHMGKICRFLPQGIQERNREIRTFMPRYGIVNERRNQLHEVIRLSGMNIIINDSDHSLIIKVASIQQARLQIYFIDNEDYFERKAVFRDKTNQFFDDNDERTMFYVRGVIETVKRLGWGPNIIHTHGWISALTPLYVKSIYKDNPLFSESKVITSIYKDEFSESFSKDFYTKLRNDKIPAKFIQKLKTPNYVNLMKSAIDLSDGIIIGSKKINKEIENYLQDVDIPILPVQSSEDYIEAYDEFYETILSK